MYLGTILNSILYMVAMKEGTCVVCTNVQSCVCVCVVKDIF